MFLASALEKLRVSPVMENLRVRSSSRPGHMALALIWFSSLAVKTGPLMTVLELVTRPVVSRAEIRSEMTGWAWVSGAPHSSSRLVTSCPSLLTISRGQMLAGMGFVRPLKMAWDRVFTLVWPAMPCCSATESLKIVHLTRWWIVGLVRVSSPLLFPFFFLHFEI